MKHPERTYLYVPFEEYPRLKELGAHFDSQRKAWYIEPAQDPSVFKRWLGDADPEDEDHYVIESDKAYIATAMAECWHCEKDTQVVTIYCEKGRVDQEPYEEFTVSNITSMDETLSKQLAPFKNFRLDHDEELGVEGFVNHCAHCKKPQGDFLLHVEPSGPFFAVQDGLAKKLIQLMPLEGKIQVNGDEGFEP